MKEKSDYLFLGALGVLIANTIFQSYLYGYLLSVNNYVGLAGWLAAFILKLGASKYKRVAIGWLLILGTLNVFSFTVGKIVMSVGNISETGAEAIGLNPLIAVFLIVYYFVNKTSVKRILSSTFKGTEEEQQTERKKQVEFYLKKFSKCSHEEFENILKDFNDYPIEAQIAIDSLRTEKKNAL